jgi:hypothetical protein
VRVITVPTCVVLRKEDASQRNKEFHHHAWVRRAVDAAPHTHRAVRLFIKRLCGLEVGTAARHRSATAPLLEVKWTKRTHPRMSSRAASADAAPTAEAMEAPSAWARLTRADVVCSHGWGGVGHEGVLAGEVAPQQEAVPCVPWA